MRRIVHHVAAVAGEVHRDAPAVADRQRRAGVMDLLAGAPGRKSTAVSDNVPSDRRGAQRQLLIPAVEQVGGETGGPRSHGIPRLPRHQRIPDQYQQSLSRRELTTRIIRRQIRQARRGLRH